MAAPLVMGSWNRTDVNAYLATIRRVGAQPWNESEGWLSVYRDPTPATPMGASRPWRYVVFEKTLFGKRYLTSGWVRSLSEGKRRAESYARGFWGLK